MEVNCKPIALAKTNAFSEIFLDYINEKPELREFYSYYPTIENFGGLIQQKNFSAASRQVLAETLTQQYKNINTPPDFSELLHPKTFTVTTGHQLNIFTGPLYVIYKIVTTVRLAQELKSAYPDYNFVPVYWMASEDHDFEEIATFSLFGKTHKWTTKQTGAVGRMNPKELKQIIELLPENNSTFEKAYLENDTLADAVRAYTHELFGQHGLVTIDADSRTLKTLFISVIKDDLLNQSAVTEVVKTSKKLTEKGYKTQLHPREINFFYLANGIRERIIEADGIYTVNNSNLRFTKTEIEQLIATEPEKFSPNVVLRPLYQEVILPNLAYIGGPSEVPYWLQLKGVFDYYKVAFPALIPRNFAVIVANSIQEKLTKLGVNVEDLFADDVALRRSFVAQNTTKSLSLESEINALTALFSAISEKGVAIDKTLKATVEAQQTRTLKAIKHLEKRLAKAEERNFESAITQLMTAKGKLFPNGSLQERKENFLNFAIHDADFVERLFAAFQPLDFQFNAVFI